MDRSPVPIPQALAAAVEHHQASRLAEAEVIYRRVLAVQPTNPDALHLLGVIFAQQGKPAEAAELIRRAIAVRPDQVELYTNLGSALSNAGRHDEAVLAYRRGIELRPDDANTHKELALELTTLNRHDEAVAAYQRVVALRPDVAAGYSNLGSALMTAGRPDEAVAALEQALQLDPACGPALTNLGLHLARQKRYEEAVAAHQRAVFAEPMLVSAHINLSDAFNALGRSEEAVAASTRALQLDPRSSKAHNNLGCSLRDLSRRPEAEALFVEAISLEPKSPEPHYNLAMALLSRGEMARGWKEYEWRFAVFPGTAPSIQRQWDGQPLEGRTLLVHAEQGLGDTLQFVRLLTLAQQLGGPGQIVFQCQPALTRLLRQCYPNVQIIQSGDPLPPVHFQCMLLSLPRVLGTTLETVPAGQPYLHASPADSATWRSRLGTARKRRRIGLVWAGSPEHPNDSTRSLTPAELAPLAGVADVQWVSVQKFSTAARAVLPPGGLDLLDLTSHLHDFADTAGLLSELDLVISVDTAVAHLAGAMGKSIWVLLPFIADWRWLQSRDDSPWYSTARLFRQDAPGDWKAVIARVVDALRGH